METEARFELIGRTMQEVAVRVEKISLELETTVWVQRGQQDFVEAIFAFQRETDKKMREMSVKTSGTDERLNILVKVVNDLITRNPQQ